MQWVDSFFSWPGGAVWGNLMASALTVLPGLAWHHRRLKRHINQAVTPPTPAAAPEEQEAAR